MGVSMRVAVLDDDQAQLELARQALEGMGHDFHGFADSKTPCERCAANPSTC